MLRTCRRYPSVTKMKGTLIALLALCLLLGGCGDAEEALPTATDRFFVNDYADVLTEADEQTVYEAGVRLMEQTEAQVVLVTVDSLGDYTLEEYALELARAWQLGDAEKDNGLLLLFTTDGPHTRAEIGYGLEGALPDSKAGRILDDYLVPHYDEPSAWSAALTATYRTYVNEVYAEYGLSETVYPVGSIDDEDGDGSLETLLFIALLVLVIFLRHKGVPVFIGGFGGHHGGSSFRGGGRSGGFSGGGGGFGGGGASR